MRVEPPSLLQMLSSGARLRLIAHDANGPRKNDHDTKSVGKMERDTVAVRKNGFLTVRPR